MMDGLNVDGIEKRRDENEECVALRKTRDA
jgi:hypothetical protein